MKSEQNPLVEFGLSDPKLILAIVIFIGLSALTIVAWRRQWKSGTVIADEDSRLNYLIRTLSPLTAIEIREYVENQKPTCFSDELIKGSAKRIKADTASATANAVSILAENRFMSSVSLLEGIAGTSLYWGLLGTVGGLTLAVWNLRSLLSNVLPEEIKQRILEVVGSFGTAFISTAIGLGFTLFCGSLLQRHRRKLLGYCEKLETLVAETICPAACRDELTIEIAKNAAKVAAKEIGQRAVEPVVEVLKSATSTYVEALSNSTNSFDALIQSETASRKTSIEILQLFETNARQLSDHVNNSLSLVLSKTESLLTALETIGPGMVSATEAVHSTVQAFSGQAEASKAFASQTSLSIEILIRVYGETEALRLSLQGVCEKLDSTLVQSYVRQDETIDRLLNFNHEHSSEIAKQIGAVIGEVKIESEATAKALKSIEPTLVGAVDRIGDLSNASIANVFDKIASELSLMRSRLDLQNHAVEQFVESVKAWEEIVRDYPSSMSQRYAMLAAESANQMSESVSRQAEGHLSKIDESITRAHDQMEALERRQLELLRNAEAALRDLPAEISKSATEGVRSIHESIETVREDLTKIIEYLRKPSIIRGRFRK